MKDIFLSKEVVTSMTKVTLQKGLVHQLLANTSVRWFNLYLHTLWYVEEKEKDLGSESIAEDLLGETKKKLHRLERLLELDKKEVIEPYWDYEWEEPEPPII